MPLEVLADELLDVSYIYTYLDTYICMYICTYVQSGLP